MTQPALYLPDIFSHKPPRILFAAYGAMASLHPYDLLAGLACAVEHEADFASVHVLARNGAFYCQAGTVTEAQAGTAGSAACPPLHAVLALCQELHLPLCLFVPDTWPAECQEALCRALADRDSLPLLVASGDRGFLAKAKEVSGCAAGYVGELSDSCQIGKPLLQDKVDLCLLPKSIASGCRLCSMRSLGVYTCVIGNCSVAEVLRMSMDGADAFLLDEPQDFAFLRERQLAQQKKQ